MDPVKVDDKVGLGLDSFLGKSEGASPKSSPAKPDDKKEAASPKSEPVEKPVEKAKEKAPEVKVEVKAEKPEAKVEAEAKHEAKAPVVEPDHKPNWDDDNNPWKKKANEFDQRYRDTHRNWNSLNQQNQELQRQLTILSKKFDGTYDPERDEPPPPDPQAIRRWGEVEGRAQASLAAAMRFHGQDKVMQALEKYQQIFGQDQSLLERNLLSDDPVQGAIDAVAAHEFWNKYGNDTGKIVDNIRKELEAELTPRIREAESKRVMDELAKKPSEPKGIGAVLGGSGATDAQVAKDNRGRPKRLNDLTGFGH